MKLKYYLRGFGTGILFATLILFFSYSYNYSNAKIKEKAKELGMVETSIESGTTIEGNTTDKDNIDKPVETTTVEEDTTMQDNTTTQENTTVQETTTAQETTTVQETIISQETTNNGNLDSSTQFEFTISRGMDSSSVSALLQRAGAIEDARDFDNYLVNNGYAERIKVGSFRINAGASYSDIANLITN